MHSFSFQRWSLLVAKHWAENKKRYLLSIAAIFALITFWFTFLLLVNDEDPMSKNMQAGAYFVSLFGIGCLYAGTFFNPLNSRSKGTFYLLTPASSLEKLLTALLFTVVFFFVVFVGVFYLSNFIMINIANTIHPFYTQPGNNGVIPQAEMFNVFYEIGPGEDAINFPIYALLAFFALQAAFLLGSVYFGQFGIVKTAIALFVLFLAVSFAEGYLFHLILPNGDHQEGLGSFLTYEAGKPVNLVMLPTWVDNTLSFVLKFAFAPLFWVVTFYRLTEKEI